jgi:hypothetical protein
MATLQLGPFQVSLDDLAEASPDERVQLDGLACMLTLDAIDNYLALLDRTWTGPRGREGVVAAQISA